MTIDDAAELLDNLRNDGIEEVPQLVDDEDTEKFCYYCGEPCEDGLCSSYCHESEDDEGRECECEE